MLFTPDATIDEVTVAPGRGYRRGKLPQRTAPVAAVVIHTTGVGPVRRFKKSPGKFSTTHEAALHIYGKLMDASGHYVVGQFGEVAQTVPEELCAWHVGSGKSRPYFRGHHTRKWAKPVHDWWFMRHGLVNPRDLADGRLWLPYEKFPGMSTGVRAPASWRRGSCNANTIGIEVVAPTLNPAGPWSPAAWRSLVLLVVDICERHDIPMDAVHIITHSDAHPLARTRRGGFPWDTGSAQFTFSEFEAQRGRLCAA